MTDEEVTALHEAACEEAGRELTPTSCTDCWDCTDAS